MKIIILFENFLLSKKKAASVTKGVLKPTISKEGDQFLSELVEKCCEFEPNKRIEFKSICNLIEEHLPKLINQNEIEYKITKSQHQETNTLSAQHEYNILSAQQQENNIFSTQQQEENTQQNYNEMKLQK